MIGGRAGIVKRAPLGCGAMRGDLATTLSKFWDGNDQWIGALLTLIGWVLVAFLVDRWFAARARKLAGRVLKHGISQETDTRLRFIRRLVWLLIIVLGVFTTLGQFTGLGRLAASLLASGALAAAIIGFAARQTLANLVAGIMLALTQPLRVGDWVHVEEHYGVVEDVRLNFTILRTLSEQRILIPNERLAGGIRRNDTLEADGVDLDVHLWLPIDADVEKALVALRDGTDQTVRVAESTVEGFRLTVGGERVAPRDRPKREAEIREQSVGLLRGAGVIGA
jgi:small-conductance mechanosensitive channel